MNTTVLVDESFILHCCFHAAESCCAKNPGQYDLTDTFLHNLKGKLRTLNRITSERGLNALNSTWVFVQDCIPTRKQALYAPYKATRAAIVGFDKLAARAGPSLYSKTFCRAAGEEADDVLATLASQITENIILITGDRDIWQIADPPRIEILNPVTEKFAHIHDLTAKFKIFDWRYIVLHKTLWGDSCDNIPNCVPRMHKQLLPLVRASDSTFQDFRFLVESHWRRLTKRCQDLLETGHEQMLINYQLVLLKTDCEVIWG